MIGNGITPAHDTMIVDLIVRDAGYSKLFTIGICDNAGLRRVARASVALPVRHTFW